MIIIVKYITLGFNNSISGKSVISRSGLYPHFHSFSGDEGCSQSKSPGSIFKILPVAGKLNLQRSYSGIKKI